MRIQDELHLLRGGLGAIDAHYETLLDHLHRDRLPVAKNVASSATLAGYEEQVAALYNRRERLPAAGPAEGVSFWTNDQDVLARRFVGLAPRGLTLEFANDRVAESLQRAVRRLESIPRVLRRDRNTSMSAPCLCSTTALMSSTATPCGTSRQRPGRSRRSPESSRLTLRS